LRFAASIAPVSESRSQGWTMAHVTAGSASHCRSSLAKPSLRRSTSCGVARSVYAIRSVGAATVIAPWTRASPSWFTQRQSNSIRCPCRCFAFAVTVAVSVSPMNSSPA
jgi:hypothetical protein